VAGRYAHYSSGVWWVNTSPRGGVYARFRGRYSDCEQWFPTPAALKAAAAPLFRRKVMTQTAADAVAAHLLIYGN
jgi:hypothetical protein